MYKKSFSPFVYEYLLQCLNKDYPLLTSVHLINVHLHLVFMLLQVVQQGYHKAMQENWGHLDYHVKRYYKLILPV